MSASLFYRVFIIVQIYKHHSDKGSEFINPEPFVYNEKRKISIEKKNELQDQGSSSKR